ncbi:hypothetical protein [Thermomonas carbonis]|uniref:Uncharacterized protein n=1 Tax=Thermomonas carbonis TaxID=1463158 RepID=A0A7G9SLI7_9GAMM|nr:hypothetical protein [Thermomonas carbonis]QNN68712.1 hypothetical protein H9L16_08070 [Thermomonas carbonis]
MSLPAPPRLQHSRLTAIAAAALGLILILQLRRYAGINHDSVLYLGQALVRRWPEIYGNDLVFVHGGGQSQYTLFPRLVAQALAWTDPATLFMWGALAAHLLFAAAGWFCLTALLPRGQRYWAWLGVLSLPTMYGMVRMFGYSEQFFTPRPLAEGLCLLGIGMLARQRWFLAAACMALAALFHPLQAIASALIVWPWAVMQDRRWLHAAWFGIPLLGLAVGGVPPFAGLLQAADENWLYILRDNTPQLFLTRWTTDDFRFLLMDVLVLAYSWHALRGAFGAWCVAGLAGLGLGLGSTLLLVDGLHLILPAGLQLWRVHWLAHWLAMAAIAALLHRDMQAKNGSRALLLAFAVSLAWGQGGWLWLAPALLYPALPRIMAERPPRVERLVGWMSAAGILLLFASYAYSEFVMFRMAHYRLDLYAIDRRLLVFAPLALGLPLLGVRLWERLATGGRTLLFVLVLCPLVMVSAVRWDLRSPEVLAFERATFRTDIFGVRIPEDAQVLWGYETLTGPWLVLQRASFFSPHQLSGQVFNRDMAMDGRRRLNRLYPCWKMIDFARIAREQQRSARAATSVMPRCSRPVQQERTNVPTTSSCPTSNHSAPQVHGRSWTR